ncbi:Uncharacterized protein APZ42_000400 [Daphnia magna]|uniref:Uncharacterized protein n=1 Tax=Daphnia magna TaxID=35525 RepID=A0A164JPF3_9CRUS|nr:Uncharacterized protein APZ42_000400 [Daphnia magna]
MHEEDKKSVNNMGWEGMKNQSRLTRVPLVIIVKWNGKRCVVQNCRNTSTQKKYTRFAL